MGNISVISCSGLVSKVAKHWYDFTILGELVRWANFPQKELRQSFAIERKPGFLTDVISVENDTLGFFVFLQVSFLSIVVILAFVWPSAGLFF